MKKNNKIDGRRLRRMAGLYTIAETATELQINLWTAYNQIREGRWSPPTTTIMQGTRRYFTRDEVQQLKRLLGPMKD